MRLFGRILKGRGLRINLMKVALLACLLIIIAGILPAIPSFGSGQHISSYSSSPSSFIQNSNVPTIGNSSTSNALVSGYQRHCFGKVQGLYWCFWSNGNNLVFSTSSDGITWSGSLTLPITQISAAWSLALSVDYSSSIVYFVFTGKSNSFLFGNGSLRSSGAISWATAQPQNVTAKWFNTLYPSITLDSNKNVEVSFETCQIAHVLGNPCNTNRHIEVWRCSPGAPCTGSWTLIHDLNVGIPLTGAGGQPLLTRRGLPI